MLWVCDLLLVKKHLKKGKVDDSMLVVGPKPGSLADARIGIFCTDIVHTGMVLKEKKVGRAAANLLCVPYLIGVLLFLEGIAMCS